MRYFMLMCLLTTLAFAQDAAPPANLVTNGSFADWKDEKPVGWTITSPGNFITFDKEDHPKEAPQCMKVHIRVTAEGQGGVTQTVRNIPANTKMTLSGIMMGSDMRLGYLGVKLKKGGKEIKREKTDWNTNDWKTATVTFDTGDADELSIECRFSQAEKAMDDKIWFTNISLTKAQP